MSVDLLTPAFISWFEQLRDWSNTSPPADAKPPVSINDLPDTKIVPLDELGSTYLSANVWNGSKESIVYAQIGNRDPMIMTRTQPGEGENILETLDPFALKRQMQVTRFALQSDSGNERAQGVELFRGSKEAHSPATPRPEGSFFWTVQSNHIWTVKLPEDLPVGAHIAKVSTVDIHGQHYEEYLAFEVAERRLDQETEAFFQSDFFEVEP
jgi:hypothetical protein